MRDVVFAPKATTPATICSIGSQVWNDLNYDGVYQPGEPGIANVRLQLWFDANNDLTDGCEKLVGWTFTDAAGHYFFDGLAPGRYQVIVSPDNFDSGAPLNVFCLSIPGTNGSDNQVDGDDNGAQPGGHGTPTSSPIITLTAGAEPIGDGATGIEWAGGGDLDFFQGDASGDMTIDFAFALPGTLAVGNLVFIDYNGNSHYDDGEGTDGVTVELYTNGQTPGVSLPLASQVTSNGGRYLFTQLVPGNYTIYIPPANFGTNGMLRGMYSVPGTTAGDDDVGEKGLDEASPTTNGVRSAVIHLDYGACPTAATGETGLDSASDDANDGDADLTQDFGFYTRVGVGNVVFFDANGDGVYTAGEGVAGVTVQLYHDWQTPEVDSPLATTVTSSQGKYLFMDLQPGYYVVHITAAMFQTGGPLKGYKSIADGKSGDDNVGEDGLNNTDPPTQGVSCAPVLLMAGYAPTALNGEAGFDSSSDDAIDAAVDLTVDFGFSRPLSIGNLVYYDANKNGHFDTGEGVANVKVELYYSGSTPGFSIPVANTVTDSVGHYRFSGLAGGTYFVFIPGSMFQPTKPLFNTMSMPGVAVANADDSKGEHGQDTRNPSATGIRTDDVLLVAGSCPVNAAASAATGENGFMSTEDDANDSDGNMTVDLGFSAPDLTKVGVGNAVYSDLNGNHRYDDGEGVSGVTVFLYSSSVTTPTATNAVASTTTDSILHSHTCLQLCR